MLIRCLYVSRPTDRVSSALISSIIAQAARKNPPLQITGLLCFTEDLFMQVIEGSRESIGILLASLYRDSRHKNLEILVYEEVSKREFEGWAMGEIDLDQVDRAVYVRHAGHARFNPYERSGGATMSLIHDLAAAGLTP